MKARKELITQGWFITVISLAVFVLLAVFFTVGNMNSRIEVTGRISDMRNKIGRFYSIYQEIKNPDCHVAIDHRHNYIIFWYKDSAENDVSVIFRDDSMAIHHPEDFNYGWETSKNWELVAIIVPREEFFWINSPKCYLKLYLLSMEKYQALDLLEIFDKKITLLIKNFSPC
jgi:hypothetical protein